MKKLFTMPDIILILWALYSTQEIILPIGSIGSRLVLLLYILFLSYYVVKVNIKKNMPRFFLAVDVLLMLVFLYYLIEVTVSGFGAVSFIRGEIKVFDQLKNVIISFAPIYAMFELTREGKITEKWIQRSFVVFALVVIAIYIRQLNRMMIMFDNPEMRTINIAYDIIPLTALIYVFRKRPLLQSVIVAVVFGLVLSTVKRGAILIFTIVVVYFIYNLIRNTPRRKRFYSWLIVGVLIIVGYRYINGFIENSEYAQQRIEKTLSGDSSGREEIYSKGIDVIKNADIENLLFGYGRFGTLKQLGVEAHNDWLEFMIDFGLLGIVVYIIYWIVFIGTLHGIKNPNIKPMIGTAFIIYFLMTFFSMSYNVITLPGSLAIGYCLAVSESEKTTPSFIRFNKL